jgi:Cdc6-like AAA superfamily ATPase
VAFSWIRALKVRPSAIDGRIVHEFGSSIRSFRVHSKDLPPFRFADIYRAIEDYCANREGVSTIEAEQDEDLNSILHGKRPRWVSRRIKQASSTAWPTGPSEEVFLPVDRFWLCTKRTASKNDRLILRARYDHDEERASLEVASEDGSAGEKCFEEILSRSIEHSIYRNRILELSYEAGTKDEFGDVERPERLRLLFKPDEPIQDSDIVIDDAAREILWRNVIDLHHRRDLLKAHLVPIRRGVLLYGPPGTGKTFACRYLCSKLPKTTRLIVTGTALQQVNAIFSVARMYQPSLVVLEDVDLVFATRAVNLYSSVLGDLLDNMDGLRPHEDIGLVLTTNAIDRMESAIRDRPGRISQCIYFGPPSPSLRHRYLQHYLRHYSDASLDLDKLVADSDGATPAFLKEWVHRAVQIASERVSEPDKLVLQSEDFGRAMSEMKRFSEGSTARIIGFHGSN